MYEYRILFPRVGSSEISREMAARTAAAERRRREGRVGAEQRAPEQHTRKERS